MKSFVSLLLVLLCGLSLGQNAFAAPLSADAVFGGEQEQTQVDSQSAEQKLERTRKLFADKDHNADAAKASTAAWKSDTDSSLSGSWFKMIQGLGICVGILLVGLHFFKKYSPQHNSRGSGRSMRVIERLSVAPKTSLVLAQVEGRKVLFAVGSDRVSFFPHGSQDETAAHFDNSLDLLCQDDVKPTDA